MKDPAVPVARRGSTFSSVEPNDCLATAIADTFKFLAMVLDQRMESGIAGCRAGRRQRIIRPFGPAIPAAQPLAEMVNGGAIRASPNTTGAGRFEDRFA
jgi:hypothetical protein